MRLFKPEYMIAIQNIDGRDYWMIYKMRFFCMKLLDKCTTFERAKFILSRII